MGSASNHALRLTEKRRRSRFPGGSRAYPGNVGQYLSFSAGCFMRIEGLNHVQLAMPPGEEQAARTFYAGLLGIPEVKKPANLAVRGGCWFERGDLKIHLGVERDFRPARKAHPALTVTDLPALVQRLWEGGYEVFEDEPLSGYNRCYVSDPFGNRIELMEPV